MIFHKMPKRSCFAGIFIQIFIEKPRTSFAIDNICSENRVAFNNRKPVSGVRTMTVLGICAAMIAVATMATFRVVMRLDTPNTPSSREIF